MHVRGNNLRSVCEVKKKKKKGIPSCEWENFKAFYIQSNQTEVYMFLQETTFFMYLPITSGTAQMVIMLPITVTLIHGHGVAYKTMHEEITSQKYKNKL